MEKLTREELFELVWTTPMSKLAARFGVSDVALAKTCAKLDIPRPGRGYWQQLAAGIAVERPPLPSSEVPGPITLDHVPFAAGESSNEPPVVTVRDTLTDPHEAVRWLQGALASTRPDQNGLLVIRNGYGPAFSVGLANVSRMLRLLDALAKALVARGHEVVAATRVDWSPLPDLLIRTQGSEFALEVEEKLVAKPRELTDREKRRAASGHLDPPQFDYVPDGDLRLRLLFTPYKYVGRKSWSDRQAGGSWGSLLGKAVIAIERAAHIGKVERDESLRLEEQRRTEERKRLRPERLRWYGEWLARDLDKMLDERDRAHRIRAFLDEYERRLPPEAASRVSTQWCRSFRELADRLDPMIRITEIAKETEPTDEVLARLVSEAGPAAR